MQEEGLMMHSLIGISEVLEVLYEEQKITKDVFINVPHFLKVL